MPLHLYVVEVEPYPDGVLARVRGTEVVWRSGPLADGDAVQRAVWALVLTWKARAERLGGRVWRPDARSIGVELPVGVPCRGALPWVSVACSVSPPAAPHSASARSISAVVSKLAAPPLWARSTEPSAKW